MEIDKVTASSGFLALKSGMDYTTGVVENLKMVFRATEMQEFVEVPTDEEFVLLVNKTVNDLNVVNPVTHTWTLETHYLVDSSLYSSLLEMGTINLIKHVIQAYVHKGIADTSIEDINIQDRQPRYEAMLQVLNEDDVKNKISNYKKSIGAGVDVEAGLSQGSVNRHHLNDFDRFGRF